MATALPIHDRLEIPAEDLEVTTVRSGGPGGQHVNTTDTRVRLRFALERCAVLSDPVKARLRDQNRSWLTSDGEMMITSDATARGPRTWRTRGSGWRRPSGAPSCRRRSGGRRAPRRAARSGASRRRRCGRT
ncbi:MAG: peptide chain release factor-like protein [Myxococcota bacterium]